MSNNGSKWKVTLSVGTWRPRGQDNFLDALASLGSMLETQSLINVFVILSNLEHIFGVYSGYVQGMFRVGSE